MNENEQDNAETADGRPKMMSGDAKEASPLQGMSEATRAFYTDAVRTLEEAGVPFLVGGAYAFAEYTGIVKHTKDFDLFLTERDCPRALDALEAAGYRTETPFPHWLAKAFSGDDFVDLIYSSGNGFADVDSAWFDNAQPGTVLGVPVLLCPPEEMIWSKSFVQERERYDGADIVHLLRSCGEALDWDRLISRFGNYWRVLFAHLVLFGFVYPGERNKVPRRTMAELTKRLERETAAPPPRTHVCQGTLISREQYLIDIDRWGYTDVRLEPRGNMSAEEAATWTAAIATGEVTP